MSAATSLSPAFASSIALSCARAVHNSADCSLRGRTIPLCSTPLDPVVDPARVRPPRRVKSDWCCSARSRSRATSSHTCSCPRSRARALVVALDHDRHLPLAGENGANDVSATNAST
ncbi:hypothetical protein C8R45DRAFT_1088497 [Mycena sanguinolenta]|nr:hypothetical protein C8R45DRAFT_1088497 [Mycena sanguinolenta]